MRSSPAQLRHLEALRAESETLARLNARILALGGRMIPPRHRGRRLGGCWVPPIGDGARLSGSQSEGP